jgi:hypothetical protein
MAIWPVDSVEDRPHVTLRDWAAFEVPLSGPNEPWTSHLAGYWCEDHQGQVCSPVQRFDPATGLCVTRSERVYRLLGRPGLDLDVEYVWQRWKGIADISEQRDVTWKGNSRRSAYRSDVWSRPYPQSNAHDLADVRDRTSSAQVFG